MTYLNEIDEFFISLFLSEHASNAVYTSRLTMIVACIIISDKLILIVVELFSILGSGYHCFRDLTKPDPETMQQNQLRLGFEHRTTSEHLDHDTPK